MRRRFWRGVVAATVVAAVATLTAIAGEGPGLSRLAAGDGNASASKPEVVEAAHGRFDGDVRKLPPGQVKKAEARPEPQVPNESPGGATTDGAVQAAASAATTAPTASASFEGLDWANWGAGWPPDTNGDVGTTQYVQTVNTSVGVYDKATHARLTAFTFDALWAMAGTGTPCDNSNQGDPVVVYDPIGDRWIISDFAWADANFSTGPFYECFAVSQTNDATRGWYFYAFKVESGAFLPDYPKLGVWPDGIYMSANVFATSGSQSFKNVQVWAFDRVAMEAGSPAAKGVTFTLPSRSQGVTIFSLLPSNMRTITGAPPAGRPNLLASIYGSYNVRVWKFHVDYVTPSSSTLTGPTNVPVSTFNVGPSASPEKGGNNLDTLTYRVMMQNQYTNIGGAESLWLTHTVGNGGAPNVAQVRWYQINVTGGTVSTTPKQQSTYAPNTLNRFTPSLAVDKAGDLAVGYTVSSSAMYPSLRYAVRAATDAANMLGAEASIVEGTGNQCCTFSDGSANQRWGDYSAMTIDPVDGCTFWYTGEYYDSLPTTLRGATGDNWKTRIGSFKLPNCA
jgi:hypothetical protein